MVSGCKFLLRYSLSCLDFSTTRIKTCTPLLHFHRHRHRILSHSPGFTLKAYRHSSRSYGSIQASVSIESTDDTSTCADEEEEEQQQQHIKLIIIRDLMRRNINDDITSLMKMERRTEPQSNRFDKFKSGTTFLSSQ
ncbi:hypothetical protein LXL04_025747 [Taraxacum kok-saghyz]